MKKWEYKLNLFREALSETTDEIQNMSLALAIYKGAVCYCDALSIQENHDIKVFSYIGDEVENDSRYKLIEVEKVFNIALQENKNVFIDEVWKFTTSEIKTLNVEIQRASEMMMYQHENLGIILLDIAERELQNSKALYNLPIALTIKELLITKIDRLGIDPLEITMYLLEKYRLSYLDLERIEEAIKHSNNENAEYVINEIERMKKRYV